MSGAQHAQQRDLPDQQPQRLPPRVVCAVCGAPLRQANPGTVSLAPSGPWIHVGGVPLTDHHEAEPELLPRSCRVARGDDRGRPPADDRARR